MEELQQTPVWADGRLFDGIYFLLSADNNAHAALSGLNPFRCLETQPDWQSCWLCLCSHLDLTTACPFKVWQLVRVVGILARFRSLFALARGVCVMHGSKNVLTLILPAVGDLLSAWQGNRAMGFVGRWKKLVGEAVGTAESTFSTDNTVTFLRQRQWRGFCDDLDRAFNREERDAADCAIGGG